MKTIRDDRWNHYEKIIVIGLWTGGMITKEAQISEGICF